jgi:hypothetical protein
VSFDLELHVAVRDWEEADRAAEATATPEHLSVMPGRRKRWGRTLGPSLHFDWRQGQDVLSDDADWDHDCFAFSDGGGGRFAATVLALADVLPPGWGVRAYWVGDQLEHERAVTPEELAGLIRRSELDRYTLYRVK